MTKPKRPCPNCQGGQRLPEDVRVEWLLGSEGSGGVVSVPGWTGALDSSGEVIAWHCDQCRRMYKNPKLAALKRARREAIARRFLG
jgi:hypothetical protein